MIDVVIRIAFGGVIVLGTFYGSEEEARRAGEAELERLREICDRDH